MIRIVIRKVVLPADEVAEAAEHEGAERAHEEAGREGEQREHVACRFVDSG